MWFIIKKQKNKKKQKKKGIASQGINNFSTLNLNDLNCHCNFKFPLVKPNFNFFNVDKNYELINKSLINLGSGIYLFWLLVDPSKCYIGYAINLKRKFNTHYKSYKIKRILNFIVVSINILGLIFNLKLLKL